MPYPKNTSIQLTFPFRYGLELLAFYISSPRYYKRSLVEANDLNDQLAILSNEQKNPHLVPVKMYADTINLSIYNGDDQPLTIDSIKAYIPIYYLVAFLEKDNNYTLSYGDSNAAFPEYDLSFKDQLPDSIPHLTLGAISVDHVTQILQEKDSTSIWSNFMKAYGIWIIILLLIVQILYIATRMMKRK